MTNLELSYMQTVPQQLRDISAALNAAKPRLVKIDAGLFINPSEVSAVREELDQVWIDTTGGNYKTHFKTVEEAVAALSLG